MNEMIKGDSIGQIIPPNTFELPLFLHHGPYPDDWKYWPEPYKSLAIKAVAKKAAEFPGWRISLDVSECLRRGDLSGAPWQLRRSITLVPPDFPK